MKCLLGLALAVLLFGSTGFAQQEPAVEASASKEDVEKLFVTLQVRQRTQAILEGSRTQTKAVLTDLLRKEGTELSPKEIAELQNMMDEMIEGIYKDYPIEAVLQDMIPVYRRHLTTSDVDALIAFYSTPVGQKLLRELPALTSEAMRVTNTRIQPRLEAGVEKFKQRLTDMLEEEERSKKSQQSPEPATKP